MIFFITGMSSSGKRSLARQLAAAFDMEFCDPSAEILELSETHPDYRRREAVALAALPPHTSCVVVTGCLTPVEHDSRRLFERGKVIYLYTDSDTLWEELPQHERQSTFLSKDILRGMYEEIADVYLNTADLICCSDETGRNAYNAARQFIELLGIL